MARLKFLAFALVALGLWAYHLTVIAPLALAGSVEQAQAAVAGAAGPVAVALESRRSLTQAVALKVVGGTAAWNAGPKPGAKPEAPTVERFAAIRTAAAEALPDELKDQLVVGLSNEVGLLWVKGSGEPATAPPEGLEFAPVVEAGSSGAVRTVDGASYLLLAVPMVISDKNEVRQAGSAIVGLPLLPDVKVLEATVKALGLKSLALVSEGKAVVSAGEKAGTDAVLAGIKPGASGSLASGTVRELGPLALPMMVETLVQSVGSRQAIGGTTLEVAASASSKAALDALASYQVFGFGGLLGLFLFAIVMTLVMGSAPEESGSAMVMPPPMPLPPVRREEPVIKPPITMPEQEAAPEASPDDFDFPVSSNSIAAQGNQPSVPPPPPPTNGSTGQSPLFEPEPTSDPFANSAPPPPPPSFRASSPPPPVATSEAPAFSPRAGLMEEDEGQRTVAYPAFKPPPGASPGVASSSAPSADPFAMAAEQQGYDSAGPSHEDNPDATRVAAVPAELIKAARAGASGSTGERPALKPNTAAMPKVASMAPAGGGNEEEKHFQEVFRDFVATREKCREPADGLTFDKFKAKLLKNKEQLVAKYQCRTVRFQVYVKDGKAALKATPVKD
ncbi:MAG: MXAN_5187 family protein [Archangium sp.]|nr:MXAN_5187 family protein [Archangium sp.]MDP3573087.1 MXAN_5187 family protein [Archangium sp.]